MTYSLKEKKFLIILMIINFFALVVNFVGLKGNIIGRGVGSGDNTNINIFTNSTGFSYSSIAPQFEVRFKDNYEHFWPFVDFTSDDNLIGYIFKGIFCYFDFTEFVLYSILIFGMPLFLKLMKIK